MRSSIAAASPRSRFVAELVGYVNIIEGRIAGREGEGWRIATALSKAPLLVDDGGAFEAGAPVAVAVRPEKMAIHAGEPEPGGPNGLPAQVSDVGYLGDTTQYRLRADNGTVLRVSRANATSAAAQPIGAGERVRLSFAPEAALILRS